MIKTILLRLTILSVFLLGIPLLVSCNSGAATPPEKWMPTTEQSKDQLPAGSVAIPAFDFSAQSGGVTAATGPARDLVEQIYSDFIFKGSVEKVELYPITYYPPAESKDDPRHYTACVLSVSIEEVYSGDIFSAGENIRLFIPRYRESPEVKNPLREGARAIFFSRDMDYIQNEDTGKTWRELMILSTPDLKEPVGSSNLEVRDPDFNILPIEGGYVSASLEWAWDVEPTVALSEDDLWELSRGIGLLIGLDPNRRAYFSEEDFARALKAYRSYYKEEASLMNDDEYKDAYQEKYDALNKLTGRAEKEQRSRDELWEKSMSDQLGDTWDEGLEEKR